MLVFLIPFICGLALFIITLLIILSGDFKKFKINFSTRPPKITEIPIITPTGQIVNSVEELDMHLEFLRTQLEEKQQELEAARTKMCSTEENLKRLTDTSSEVKKYFVKLRTEIFKSESECTELKAQIEDYKNRQMRLRDEVNENVKYYTHLLSNIDSGTGSSNEDYELVKKVPLQDRKSERNSEHLLENIVGLFCNATCGSCSGDNCQNSPPINEEGEVGEESSDEE